MGKIRRIFALTLVIALVAAIFGACAKKNESDSAYVQEKGTLIVGITDYAPMDYKEKGSDEWTGFNAELSL